MQLNYNFVMTVGLTNDEHCLIHSLHVENTGTFNQHI